jgi:hypothetical protein
MQDSTLTKFGFLHKGYQVKCAIADEADPPDSPILHLTCWHRNYQIGEKHRCSDAECFLVTLINEYAPPEASEYFEKFADYVASLDVGAYQVTLLMIVRSLGVYIRPLYYYEHGGIAIRLGPSTGAFTSFDTGFLGFAWGDPPKNIDEMDLELAAYIAEYNDYLAGDVWDVEVIDPETEEVVDRWRNLYGADEAREVGEDLVDSIVRYRNKHG